MNSGPVRGLIFNIQGYTVHDGPGIRSVIFLQGCPLRCPWCANPESQQAAPMLMHQNKSCVFCGLCAAFCPREAIKVKEMSFCIDRSRCAGCMTCEKNCPNEAIRFSSHRMSIGEILSILRRDDPYYEESGGGITISGGEPFFQFSGLMPLVQVLKKYGYHVCLETCGQAALSQFKAASPYIDCFLYDMKHTDENILRRSTGGNLPQIMENLRFLCDRDPGRVVLRTPVIPGFNYDRETLQRMAQLAKALDIPEIHYLPFHTLGKGKYEQLDRPYSFAEEKMLTEQELKPYAEYARSLGLAAYIGG